MAKTKNKRLGKPRLKAERVTGKKIEYLYEHEAQENEV